METPAVDLAALGDRYVAELFTFNPAAALANGDHSRAGRLGPVGSDATAARVAQLDSLAAAAERVTARGPEQRADLITLRHRLALERFELVELESPRTNPLDALFRAADPQAYCTHDWAPVPVRAEALERQLRDLPEWLDAALAELGEALDPGPRSLSIDVAGALASFYSDEVGTALPLPDHPEMSGRLRRSAETAAAACRRFAAAVEQRAARPTPKMGERRFLAMLGAQEGVTETVAHLREMADAELARLDAEYAEAARGVAGGGGIAAAVRRMEDDHPSADSLIPEAASSLDRLRAWWRERDLVTVPDLPCRVLPSPPFLRHFSAAFDGAGPLAAPEVESNYIITPVDGSMSEQQADEWLRSLNRSLLETVAVHEVYPGHFVHALHVRDQPSLVRRIGFLPGFGEGWAHYTEQLAIEHGLADGRPLVRLAQLQEALLRACRFRATLALHTEEASVDDVTRMFIKHTGLPEFPARREAERGTYDPMYLSYTYGKLQILAWRAELERRPGFSLRRFHDTMIGSGVPPLAAVRELVLATDPS